jgi:hypothetical protein
MGQFLIQVEEVCRIRPIWVSADQASPFVLPKPIAGQQARNLGRNTTRFL